MTTPTISATVVALAVGPPGGADRPINRERRPRLEFVIGKGVVGDKTFGKSELRQVNLISRLSYEWFERNFGRVPDTLGEQVLVSRELDPNWLDLGQRLRVGTAILEVTTPRMPCAKFTETVQGGKVSYFVGHVGVLCRVVEGGHATKGDPVELIANPPAIDQA
jgi:MOSC domain-containing protein YiiM